jgi:hypothetical protein
MADCAMLYPQVSLFIDRCLPALMPSRPKLHNQNTVAFPCRCRPVPNYQGACVGRVCQLPLFARRREL